MTMTVRARSLDNEGSARISGTICPCCPLSVDASMTVRGGHGGRLSDRPA